MKSIWQALSDIALHHGRRVSARELHAQSTDINTDATMTVAACVLQRHGFGIKISQAEIHEFCASQLPMLVSLKNSEVACWKSLIGDEVVLRNYGVDDKGQELTTDEVCTLSQLQAQYGGTAILVAPDALHDAEYAGDAGSQKRHWFWSVFVLQRRYYGDCVVAAMLINLLALAGSMFSMNVYDRVIPNGAIPTLWVLAIGVTLAGLFEFGLRTLRAHVVDEAGKRADLMLSSAIFRKTLDLKAKDRPASSGQYAGQVREFDSVREFVSSTTLVGLTDLPFTIVFFIVISYLAGQLVWVPLVAGVLILLVGMVSQWPIRWSVERYQYENSQKLAFMVEAVERVETIQAVGAQNGMQGRWERLCAITARSAMGSRLASSAAVNLTQFLQQLSSTALVLWGVHLIFEGHLTTGGLIGCSILAGRALSPLAQVAGLMTRWQQTKIAYLALNQVMNLAGRYDDKRTYVQLKKTVGVVEIKGAEFSYPRSEKKILQIKSLMFKPGEIVAIMGPVGSGKSTLLKVMAGLHTLDKGQLLLDDIDQTQISPADFCNQVAWVSQDPVLFRGSMRENLLIARPQVSEQRLMHVLRLTGVQQLANQHPMGLDMQLGENGQALSGGQRQMVALARALLSSAQIVLLDEPTSSFDEFGELQLLRSLQLELEGRTVILVTHRPAPLGLAKRLVIMESGQVVADGPRDSVLKAVRDGQVSNARSASDSAVQDASPRNSLTEMQPSKSKVLAA